MSTPNLLTSSQNEAIEDKYSRNILYFLLRTVCEPILADSMTYEIRSGELFYHCVYSLDSLKGSDVGKMDAYCMDLYDEMLNYSAKKGWNRKNSEVREMACLVAYSVARCLLLTKDSLYSPPTSTIIARLQSEDPTYSFTLQKRFNKAIKTIGEHKLGTYLQEYMQSPVMLSDEIEAIIEQEQEQKLLLPKPKLGRQQIELFMKFRKKDKERTTTECEHFKQYLRNHKLSQKQFDSKRDSQLMKIIVSFYLQWAKRNYVPKEPNGMAVYRFLQEDCGLEFSVTGKAFANTFRSMVQDNEVDSSVDMDVQEFFNTTIRP